MKNNSIFFFIGGVIITAIILFGLQDAKLGSVRNANIFSSTTDSAVTVATSSTAILARDTNRQYARICNDDGTNYVDVNFSSTASSTTGFKLEAGECYEIKGENLYVGAISGIANSASVVLTVLYK